LPDTGGAGRDRTGDLLNANQALSQLSYSPRIKNNIEADWTRAPTTSIDGHEAIKLLSGDPETDYGVERLLLT
jgi:hypothetical protein